MNVFGNLEKQDGDRTASWILIFAIYSLNRQKIKTDENKRNLKILAETERKLMTI